MRSLTREIDWFMPAYAATYLACLIPVHQCQWFMNFSGIVAEIDLYFSSLFHRFKQSTLFISNENENLNACFTVVNLIESHLFKRRDAMDDSGFLASRHSATRQLTTQLIILYFTRCFCKTHAYYYKICQNTSWLIIDLKRKLSVVKL